MRLNGFTLNQIFLTCMLKSGELFFFSYHCFACFFGHSEAKDQVKPFLCFCRRFLCHIIVMAVFLSGSEYKQTRCFSSSRSFLCTFSELEITVPHTFLQCGPHAPYPEPFCCKADWICFNTCSINSSCCIQPLWKQQCKY